MTVIFTFHYLEQQKDANIHTGGATLLTKCYVPGSTVALLNPPSAGIAFFHFSWTILLKTLPLSYSAWPQRTSRARGQNKQKQVASIFLSLFSFPFQRSIQTLDHTPPLTGLTQPQRLITAKPTKCYIMLCTMKKCKNMLLSHLSRVRLCATPQMAAHQAPPSLGFSRQEHWSRLPFPSPVHESEKGK